MSAEAAPAAGVVVASAVVLTLAGVRRGLSVTRAGPIRRRLIGGGSQSSAVHHEIPVPARGGVTSRLPAPPAWFVSLVASAAFTGSASLIWAAGWAVTLAGGISAWLVGGPRLAGLVVATTVGAALIVLRAARGRGAAKLEAALPGGLEAVARSLRTGASLRQALAEAGSATPAPLGPELTLVAGQAGHGMPMVEALEAFAARHPLPGVRLATAALCLAVETGGAQARAVDGVAATLRDRLAVAADVKALSAQARLSALVISLAPVAFGAFAATTDPRTATFLFRTPAGLGLLAGGILLDAVGALWMRRLARPPV